MFWRSRSRAFIIRLSQTSESMFHGIYETRERVYQCVYPDEILSRVFDIFSQSSHYSHYILEDKEIKSPESSIPYHTMAWHGMVCHAIGHAIGHAIMAIPSAMPCHAIQCPLFKHELSLKHIHAGGIVFGLN